MIVLQACGYGPNQLLKHSFVMAIFVALVVLIIMLWASPLIAIERAKLLRTSGVQTLIQTISPGQFREVQGGRQVFYVKEMNPSHTVASHVFLARLNEKEDKKQWDILWAEKAFAETGKNNGEDHVIFTNGDSYQGVPGQADYQVAEFDSYKARLPHPVVRVKEDIRTAKTKDLLPFFNSDPRKVAELQWRLSVPIMVLTLTLVGVSLSRVNPRAGKYAKLLPAIVLYIIYANFMFIARDWLISGKTPLWLGIWWIHIPVFLLGLFLVWRNQVKLS
jgi:lipopolysaccharide export system permease protein